MSILFMGGPNNLYDLSSIRNFSTKEKLCTKSIPAMLSVKKTSKSTGSETQRDISDG